MTNTISRGALILGLSMAGLVLLGHPSPVQAQYFGRNKVQYDKFKFQVLATPHFDIHYYPEETEAAKQAARMAERWHTRLSRLLGHELTGRQPVVLYASHPDFEQTNVIEGELGEGTGGVTEGAKRRVIMPMAASLGDTDHVLGHELVHAFQYDILGPVAGGVPLWFIEGMAEYLSLGARDPQTAMWLRDAAIENRLPTVEQLDDPRFFPYRFGHAFWAYVGGRWGDAAVGQILKALAPAVDAGRIGGMPDAIGAIEAATGKSRDELSAEWHASIRETYGIAPRPAEARPGTVPPPPRGRLVIARRTGSGDVNVGPALSPDGTRVAFLSERDRLSIDFYVADATTGRVIRRLIRTAADPHFESLQFLASAGAWDPEGRRLAVATIRGGSPVLAILDASNGDVVQEVKFPELGEIFQPTWAPDGRTIAFSAQEGGVTDLFVHDLASASTRRLTNDAFADLQPAFSPDGARLVFISDRFGGDLNTLSFGNYRLAQLTLADGATSAIDTGLEGNAFNPQWSADGKTLYFISDSGGRRDVWRLEPGAGRATRLTSEATGVAGITPTSPALSVAARASKAAITVFRDGGYELHILDPAADAAPRPTGAAAAPAARDLALLPPITRSNAQVDEQLRQSSAGLPGAADLAEKQYSPRLELIGIGQQVGVSTGGQFGTFLNGGIALQFSDLLGNHLLGTSFGVDGGVKDVAAGVSYLNRTSRWNWGVFGERVPLLSGRVGAGFVEEDGNLLYVEQTELFRQTYQQGGAVVAYPFSRVTRVEFSGAARHIGFETEVRTRVFDPNSNVLLFDEKTELPSPDSLTLFDVGAALVRDTAAFGATSPVLGQRMRLDVTPTFGDLDLVNLTLDYRQYVMPVRPVTFAGRVLHVGRYGGSGEDQRLMPLFLGYSTLVRGYDVDSFEASECSFTEDGTCPEFERLLGSRILVVNAEMRVPLVGAFTGKLDYGPVPVELIGFFDSGVAWTRTERPTFADGPRTWVSSVGAGARVNLFGFAIGEFNLARPLNRKGRGWMFVFNLRPGF